MVRIQYQLLKDNEPIALGSMVHCLDVFYWEIYYGYNHLEYDIVPFSQEEEVYRKAKAFDEVKKHVDEQGDSYMDLYRQTKDPTYSLLNSHYDNLLGFIEELEDE